MHTKMAPGTCAPCEGQQSALKAARVKELARELDAAWSVKAGKRLEREFEFKDFKAALDFTIRVGRIAERVQHHPDIYLAWGKVRLDIWTHSVGGLTEADFVLAAKVDALK